MRKDWGGKGNPKFRHGLSHTPLHMIWGRIKQRCLNPKCSDYPYYGGRGITICEEWCDDFLSFVRGMGPRPSPKHTVDRIDNDGPYAPWNCRWATRKEQSNNSRTPVFVEAGGIRLNLSDWAKRNGVSETAVVNRIRKGMDPIEAVTKPFSPPNQPIIITFNGRTQNLAAWAREIKISRVALSNRLRKGMSIGDALQAPSQSEKRLKCDS